MFIMTPQLLTNRLSAKPRRIPLYTAFLALLLTSALAAQPSFNPLASADPLVGTFVGDGLTITLTGGAGQYQGQLEFNGQVFSLSAAANGGELRGAFTSSGTDFPFTATLEGDVLTLFTGGVSYRTLRRLAGPAGDGLAAGPSPNDSPVIARGQYADLTEDNARAFIEAFEFALVQVGYPYQFSEAEKQQLLQAIGGAFPGAEQMDQALLAHARELWERVQENWATAGEQERRDFILGVFVLALGEDYVRQNLGQGGGGSSGNAGSCSDIDSCTLGFLDGESYNDFSNSQSCWAAAGCESYDPSTNTFEYDEPSFDYSDPGY